MSGVEDDPQMSRSAASFAAMLAELLAKPNPTPGSMAADLQAAAKRDGITDAGLARIVQQLRGGRTDG